MRMARDDSGVALVAVMGAIALISIIAISGYTMSSQALFDTTRLSSESKAFQVAASGMDRELASFTEDSFTSGSSTYTKSMQTPDGTYQLTVGRDPSVPYRFTMTCVGTSGGRTSTVEQSFFYMDLWGMSVSAGSNPEGEFGSGAGWNGNSTIYGPLYVSGDVDLNSNPDLWWGPLFISNGDVDFGAAVDFHPYTDEKYNIFAGGAVSGADSDTQVFNSCPTIDLPWLDDAYFDGMRDNAVTESKDKMFGASSVAEIANNEVDVVGGPYVGQAAPGATADYKVINGPLTITGATASFGKLAAQRDDFAFDTASNILYLDGVVFVDGDVTIGAGVAGYAGSGMLVSTGDVTIATGSSFQPINDNGDGVANDLSVENCLGVATMGDIVIRGCTFEGVVFTNNALRLAKVGGTDAEFEGAVHSNNIISDTPQNVIEMEQEFSSSNLPVGMAGSSTDPRGAGFSSSGMVVPYSWIRR